MDVDALIGDREPADIEDEVPVVNSRTRFTSKEIEFIRQNHDVMTDKQIASALGRSRRSIEHMRSRMKLPKVRSSDLGQRPKSRRAFLATLDDLDKERFLLKELRRSALYRTFADAYAREPKYIKLYESKYVEFMMDPTIETVTSMERDIWHEMTMAQIREMDYLRREKEEITVGHDGDQRKPSYAKEIEACQDTIRKCQESLNVERRQRLKNSTDSAVSFTQVIKDLRSPRMRKRAGEVAMMLKYIAERHFNDHVDKNIISGAAERFNLGSLFRDGKEPEFSGKMIDGKPERLDGDFEGQNAVRKLQGEGGGGEGEAPLYAD